MPTEINKQVRTMLHKHLLLRLDARFTKNNVILQAIPEIYNPIVEQRKTAAFAEHHGQAMTLAEATQITLDASSKPIFTVGANTIEEALNQLKIQLEKVSDAEGTVRKAQNPVPHS